MQHIARMLICVVNICLQFRFYDSPFIPDDRKSPKVNTVQIRGRKRDTNLNLSIIFPRFFLRPSFGTRKTSSVDRENRPSTVALTPLPAVFPLIIPPISSTRASENQFDAPFFRANLRGFLRPSRFHPLVGEIYCPTTYLFRFPQIGVILGPA